MRYRNLIALACSVAVVSTQAFAQNLPRPVTAVQNQGASVGPVATVKIVRGLRSSDDPLTKYGAGFFVVVFNKSNQPINISPDMVTIKDRSGNPMHLLTPERLIELKQQEADKVAAVGTAISMLGMFGGGMAALRGNPAVAAQTLALTETAAVAMLTISQSNAAGIASEQDALAAGYAATPFPTASVAPLSASSGRIIVEGLKDRDPAVLIVNVAGEPHEVDFGRAMQ